MTDEQAEALGRRLLACDGFRWMPGMLARHAHTGPIRVLCDQDGENYAEITVGPGPDGNEMQRPYEWGVVGRFPASGAFPCWPDMRDPATLGCALALVRERHGGSCCCVPAGHEWDVDDGLGDSILNDPEPTEAEALVAAMEAAP